MERINPAIIDRDHPEGVCQECGGPNISWWADSALFNSVADRAEILCPLCFAGRITQRPELMHSLELRAAPRSRADGPRTAEMFTRAEIDSVIARAEKVEAERDQAKHVAANHWTYAMQLKAERDQLREQLDVAREQHDNITRAMQERIEQAKAERDRLMVENDSLREIAESWRRIKAERDQLRSLLVEINREAYDTTSGNVSHRTSRIMALCRDGLGVEGPGQPWRDLP